VTSSGARGIMTKILLTIDDTRVSAQEGWTILEAATEAGVYIPALCAYPGLPSAHHMKARTTIFRDGKPSKNTNLGKGFEGCQLCVVEVAGKGITLACNTPGSDGLVVLTNTLPVQRLRRENLARILAKHPHTCLVCPQREGCDTLLCSYNVPREERCCWKFDNCELGKVAQYIGLKGDGEVYIPRNLPIVSNDLILFDHNLCIGCLRCLRVCQGIQGESALGFIYQDGEVIVGTIGPSLKESGCKSCGACIEVCPSGALKDKVAVKAKRERARKLKILPPILPPQEWLRLTEMLATVPEKEGVYQLLDGQKRVIHIKGTMNLFQELKEQLETNGKACYFRYEEEPMYTRRESELIQQYLQQHGELPFQNLDLEEM